MIEYIVLNEEEIAEVWNQTTYGHNRWNPEANFLIRRLCESHFELFKLNKLLRMDNKSLRGTNRSIVEFSKKSKRELKSYYEGVIDRKYISLKASTSDYSKLIKAARNLRKAQEAYMEVRGNENIDQNYKDALGRIVAEAASELDKLL